MGRDLGIFLIGAAVGFAAAHLLKTIGEEDAERQIDQLTSDIDERLETLERTMKGEVA